MNNRETTQTPHRARPTRLPVVLALIALIVVVASGSTACGGTEWDTTAAVKKLNESKDMMQLGIVMTCPATVAPAEPFECTYSSPGTSYKATTQFKIKGEDMVPVDSKADEAAIGKAVTPQTMATITITATAQSLNDELAKAKVAAVSTITCPEAKDFTTPLRCTLAVTGDDTIPGAASGEFGFTWTTQGSPRSLEPAPDATEAMGTMLQGALKPEALMRFANA